jgi:hypothetical protein
LAMTSQDIQIVVNRVSYGAARTATHVGSHVLVPCILGSDEGPEFPLPHLPRLRTIADKLNLKPGGMSAIGTNRTLATHCGNGFDAGFTPLSK